MEGFELNSCAYTKGKVRYLIGLSVSISTKKLSFHKTWWKSLWIESFSLVEIQQFSTSPMDLSTSSMR